MSATHNTNSHIRPAVDRERGVVSLRVWFSHLLRQCYSFEIDLFADSKNHIVDNYPLDAFNFDWATHVPTFVNPPFHMIDRLMSIITEDHSFVLLVPYWPQEGWFRFLLDLCEYNLVLPRRANATHLGPTRDWNLCLFVHNMTKFSLTDGGIFVLSSMFPCSCKY
jgi:hypothetical protein